MSLWGDAITHDPSVVYVTLTEPLGLSKLHATIKAADLEALLKGEVEALSYAIRIRGSGGMSVKVHFQRVAPVAGPIYGAETLVDADVCEGSPAPLSVDPGAT